LKFWGDGYVREIEMALLRMVFRHGFEQGEDATYPRTGNLEENGTQLNF